MEHQKLLSICKEWMSKQDKLYLYRDYHDYLEPDQVREFLSYVETEIEQGSYLEPKSYLYDWFTNQDNWFNEYEQQQYYDAFRGPFMEQHPELEEYEDEIDEILRELMYDMDMYDADMDHRDKDYNFYLLTDPEKTVCIRDYPYSINNRGKYYQSLKLSQGWTEKTKSMQTLLDGAYDYLGVCIMYNGPLFNFINMMKAKRLTVKKGSAVYLFNPFNGSGGCETELERDWSFNLNLSEIGFGVDGAKRGPWGYCPSDVYGWIHSYFNKNKITYKSLKSGK